MGLWFSISQLQVPIMLLIRASVLIGKVKGGSQHINGVSQGFYLHSYIPTCRMAKFLLASFEPWAAMSMLLERIPQVC